MRRDNLSAQPADRADRSGWSRVDATFIETAKRVLRRTAEPAPCWWCRRPLTGPTCPTCDAEGVA